MSDTLQFNSLFGKSVNAVEHVRTINPTSAAKAKAKAAGKPEPTARQITMIAPEFESPEAVSHFFVGIFNGANAHAENSGGEVLRSMLRSHLEEATAAMIENAKEVNGETVGDERAYENALISATEKADSLKVVLQRIASVGAELAELNKARETKGFGPGYPFADEGALAQVIANKSDEFLSLIAKKATLEEAATKASEARKAAKAAKEAKEKAAAAAAPAVTA